jgi:hypothetical protein
LQAIEGPGQALLAHPLHRTAIKTGPEGVVQGPAGIHALALEIAEVKASVQVEANEIHQIIDAGICAFAIGQGRQRLFAIAQISEYQGRQKPINLVVKVQGLDQCFPLVGDGTDKWQEPTEGLQETPARQIPLGGEGQRLVQNGFGAADRLPLGPTHGPGRTQEAMGIGKKAGAAAEAGGQAPGMTRTDQGFTGVERLAAAALAPLGLAPMLQQHAMALVPVGLKQQGRTEPGSQVQVPETQMAILMPPICFGSKGLDLADRQRLGKNLAALERIGTGGKTLSQGVVQKNNGKVSEGPLLRRKLKLPRPC